MACNAEQSEVLLSQRPILDAAVDKIVSDDDDVSKAELACSKYCKILDEYLEMSTLLDPMLTSHTQALCDSVMRRLKTYMSLEGPDRKLALDLRLSIHFSCQCIYALSKVRGLKPYSTYLPHQVMHLRFLLPAIVFADENLRDHGMWQTRYVIYIWSAVAVRVPFPLLSIVPSDVIASSTLAARTALIESSGISDVAAAFLARLLSRRDAVELRKTVINGAVSSVLDNSAPITVRAASLSILCSTFKFTHRDDLRPFIPTVVPILHNFQPNSTIEFHRLSKLSHRIALAFLPPQPASWRYARDTRCVSTKKNAVAVEQCLASPGHEGVLDNDGDDYSFIDENMPSLELIIDTLFEFLRHRDTVVRYSASKGVARIAAKLPRSFAKDIVDSLLELFDDRDESRSDATIHGGCLAVAELARRGLLLPQESQFSQALDAIRNATHIDVRRGNASIGAHVRDAACYAIWGIARAYDSDHIAPFSKLISDSMIPVALFDREVNCRRAAAAALQECVGRLADDVFPAGIELITIADYFSLSDRCASYLSIAPKIAGISDGVYLPCILNDIWKRKIVHWDLAIRTLAAKTLAVLTRSNSSTKDLVNSKIFPTFVTMSTRK